MSYSSAYAAAQSTVPPPSAPGISGVLPGQQAVNTTRVLSLTGFSKDLKTRDIQAIFVEYEDDRGGYRIKWLDDTGCLIVFNDPLAAKRAFLQLTANPHPHLMPVISNDPETASTFPKLVPYIGEDAGTVIASVASRPRSRSNAQNNAAGAVGTTGPSPSAGNASAHHRRMSNSSGAANPNNRSFGRASMSQYQMQAIMDEARSATAPSTPPKLPKVNGAASTSGEGTPPSPSKEGSTPNGGAIDWAAYQQASASRPRNGSGAAGTTQAASGPAFSPPTSPERTLGGPNQRTGATSPSNLRRMVSANRS